MNLTMAGLRRAWLIVFLLISLVAAPACGIIRRIATTPVVPRETPAQAEPSGDPSPTLPDGDSINSIKLIIPVEGVRPDDLLDTFNKSRSGGRAHHAIDIMAPKGAPVLAAADGEIVRVVRNKRGGNTIYQLSADKRLIYYYAHLDRYADELAAGQSVRQGDVIGYVGDTGNAGAGNYHLHFSIWIITDPKKLWQGDNINPYPILSGIR